jgi:hypothetical protein
MDQLEKCSKQYDSPASLLGDVAKTLMQAADVMRRIPAATALQSTNTLFLTISMRKKIVLM